MKISIDRIRSIECIHCGKRFDPGEIDLSRIMNMNDLIRSLPGWTFFYTGVENGTKGYRFLCGARMCRKFFEDNYTAIINDLLETSQGAEPE